MQHRQTRLGEKNGDNDKKKISDINSLVTTTVLNIRFGEAENKIQTLVV